MPCRRRPSRSNQACPAIGDCCNALARRAASPVRPPRTTGSRGDRADVPTSRCRGRRPGSRPPTAGTMPSCSPCLRCPAGSGRPAPARSQRTPPPASNRARRGVHIAAQVPHPQIRAEPPALGAPLYRRGARRRTEGGRAKATAHVGLPADGSHRVRAAAELTHATRRRFIHASGGGTPAPGTPARTTKGGAGSSGEPIQAPGAIRSD